MAIDSKNKRGSVIGIVTPSGTIDSLERATIIGIYGGNEFPGSVAIQTPGGQGMILGFNPMGSNGPTLGGGM